MHGTDRPRRQNAASTSPMHDGVKDDPRLLKGHPGPGGGKVDLVACTAKTKAERIGFVFAENELES
jgi:hypothetical protein